MSVADGGGEVVGVGVELGLLGEGVGDVVADVVAGPADDAGSAEQPERITTTAARTAAVVAARIRGRPAMR